MRKSKKKFATFKPAGLSEWENAAREEIKGADPWKKLGYHHTGVPILPYYDASHAKKSPPLLVPGKTNFSGPRTWYNCPVVTVRDAKKANGEALSHLQEGADGVFFEVDAEVDFDNLLKSIQWEYCSLNFLVKKNAEGASDRLKRYISKKKIVPDKIHGAFFGNIPLKPIQKTNFRFSGFQAGVGSNHVEQISSAFTNLLNQVRGNLKGLSDTVAVSTVLGNDFFVEIAKLQAMRAIWLRILKEKKISNPRQLFIHALSTPWAPSEYQPHGNMIKSTTAAMAAILGGCDVLTIAPEVDGQPLMSRVARNVSNILREESHFARVADPVSGSYFISNLREEMTSAAWPTIKASLKP